MVALGCAALVVAYFVLDMNLSQNLIPKSSNSFSFRERTGQNRRISASWGPPPTKSNPAPISCDRSHHDYDICSVNGPLTLDQAKPIFYTSGPTGPISDEKLRPYPRKWESFTMSSIKEVTLVTSAEAEVPPCRVRHDAPALVFSAGGYTGNFFHDFNDGFIPLFITINTVYNGSNDVILIISKAQDWWMRKYAEILRAFSRHEIVDLDNHKVTHCFTSATVGLVSHGFMTIDPARIPNGKSFTQFRAILDKAFSSKGTIEKQSKPLREIRPRLVLATRSGSGGRVIMNQKELKNAAVQEGFEVIEFEPTSATPLQQSYDLLQSSHALVGVHGAALTHILFLRPGSTFLQIIPIGADWVSEVCFGKPARHLGLDYLQYDVVANESTLMDKYGADHPLIRDPAGSRGGWKTEVMSVYLKEQNVKVDLVRFRGYLQKMYSKAKMFIENENK
uniref:Glycosyltransferase 61 catalytic domain-containing protein n=1 Tax=Kalanchoe fedtschenkoi TaxID=63787 RepID=A0A7N0ULL6_KALFE